jgi:dephospho-CoA kinase
MATSDSKPKATRPYIVALTGGIASGKTTVANLFAELGVPVIDADQLARDVVAPGHPALARVVEAFGPEILDASGSYDRKRMRERVFADPTQRQVLESILHPAIRDEFARRSAAAVGPYQLHVIPLLVEGGRESTAERVLVVDCPEETQLARLQARDAASPEQARQILAAQASRAQRLAAADDVVVNDGRIAELTARVRELHEKYLGLAAKR